MSAAPALLRPRPTVYRGVPMRSRLEARFAAALDAEEAQWEYEPRAYADGFKQYLPDFEVVLANGRWTFFEVKPTIEAARAAVEQVRTLFASEHDPELLTCIVWPTAPWAGPSDWKGIGVDLEGVYGPRPFS